MEKQIFVSDLKNYFTQSIEQPFYLKDIIQKERLEKKNPYLDLYLNTLANLPASLKGNGNFNGRLLLYRICTQA